MRKILTNLAILIFITYGFKNVSFGTDNVKPAIEWINLSHNFGKIEKNKTVTATFKFLNKSMTELVISSVRPSCGCTVTEYPKNPIKPQETTEIKVVFDAKVSGFFRKSISVFSNASDKPDILIIEGEVIQK